MTPRRRSQTSATSRQLSVMSMAATALSSPRAGSIVGETMSLGSWASDSLETPARTSSTSTPPKVSPVSPTGFRSSLAMRTIAQCCVPVGWIAGGATTLANSEMEPSSEPTAFRALTVLKRSSVSGTRPRWLSVPVASVRFSPPAASIVGGRTTMARWATGQLTVLTASTDRTALQRGDPTGGERHIGRHHPDGWV